MEEKQQNRILDLKREGQCRKARIGAQIRKIFVNSKIVNNFREFFLARGIFGSNQPRFGTDFTPKMKILARVSVFFGE